MPYSIVPLIRTYIIFLDVGTTQTVAYMKEHLDGSDLMVTNIIHLNKRVLKFYFA